MIPEVCGDEVKAFEGSSGLVHSGRRCSGWMAAVVRCLKCEPRDGGTESVDNRELNSFLR